MANVTRVESSGPRLKVSTVLLSTNALGRQFHGHISLGNNEFVLLVSMRNLCLCMFLVLYLPEMLIKINFREGFSYLGTVLPKWVVHNIISITRDKGYFDSRIKDHTF